MFLHKKNTIQFLAFLLLASCANPSYLRHGKVSPNNTADRNSFIFSVDDEFAGLNPNSPQDKKNPKLTEAESGLLYALLKQKKYCLNDSGSPRFSITSRQEKIYDMTFAHMIQEEYNAKPVAPRMYFGQCA